MILIYTHALKISAPFASLYEVTDWDKTSQASEFLSTTQQGC